MEAVDGRHQWRHWWCCLSSQCFWLVVNISSCSRTTCLQCSSFTFITCSGSASFWSFVYFWLMFFYFCIDTEVHRPASFYRKWSTTRLIYSYIRNVCRPTYVSRHGSLCNFLVIFEAMIVEQLYW